jgi:hypothetical protein
LFYFGQNEFGNRKGVEIQCVFSFLTI